MIDNSSYSCLIEIRISIRVTSDSPTYIHQVCESELGYFRSLIESSFSYFSVVFVFWQPNIRYPDESTRILSTRTPAKRSCSCFCRYHRYHHHHRHRHYHHGCCCHCHCTVALDVCVGLRTVVNDHVRHDQQEQQEQQQQERKWQSQQDMIGFASKEARMASLCVVCGFCSGHGGLQSVILERVVLCCR